MITAGIRLNEDKERLLLALESARLGTYDLELGTEKINYSPRFAEIFGYSEEEKNLAHQDFISRIHPHDQKDREQAHEMALLTGTLKYEARLLIPNLSMRWIKVMGKILHDNNKKPSRVLGTVMDITETKEAELQLKENEAYSRQLIQGLPIALYTVDAEGRLKQYNDAALELWERVPIEGKEMWCGSQRLYDIEGNWVPHDQCPVALALRENKPYTVEAIMERPSGERRYVLACPRPLHDIDGKVTGVMNVVVDITDRKKAEVALKEIAGDLEKRVDMRTHELKQVNEELVRTNNALEQFAYVASHDLQEPLRKIQMFSELLQTGRYDETSQKTYFNKINAAAQRMSALIKDVLNYSRLSISDVPFEEINPRHLLEEIKSDFEVLVAEKHAVIQYTGPENIKGIPLQISQLFSNLIGNSLKFAQNNASINITAKLLTGDEIAAVPGLQAARNYVCLTFQDNGIGFEQKYAEQIFVIFHRLHKMDNCAGTGIGLALCKKIAENHKGIITAFGEPGKGARFDVYLAQ